jgi:hypothetical protein
MKQTTFASNGFELVTKRMFKCDFFGEINLVVCWKEVTGLIQSFAPASKTGRPPFYIATMLRIHFLQQWFGLNDPAMEDALHDMARRDSSAATSVRLVSGLDALEALSFEVEQNCRRLDRQLEENQGQLVAS